MTIKKTLLIAGIALGCAGAWAQTQQQDNFRTATRAFYLWRCGTAVQGDHNGCHYETEACHLGDGLTDYVGLPGGRKDGTGGWHDAGDYGKYTVNAGVTMGCLFYAWDHYGDKMQAVALDLPETAPGYPEFLKELKWETDFLLKMQYPDGSGRVSHKLTRRNFADFIMPQDDHGDRYFTEWSSAATADFAAMMAMASRYFRPYDEAYAQQCLDAALLSYKYLVDNPQDVVFKQGDFVTGGYQTWDPDDRLWAAAEVWEATGDPAALADLESRLAALGDKAVESNWDWGNVANLGAWTYAQSKREGRNPELVAAVERAICADAEAVAKQINSDEWGCPINEFFWGCNGLIARLAVNLHMAELVCGADYAKEKAAINAYLLGNNPYGRSLVTGIGPNPPMHPHDRRSAADGVESPWPGYLVGGGHTATDWVDDQDDYSRNEIAINWQAGLVYLFATQL